jgi:DNA polymerase-3 subunit delta'
MNWNLIGHEWAVQMLKQHVAQGTHRQAYLFTGPESVGRSTLALRFAQAINCPQPIELGEPCLDCPTCSQLERYVHPDLAIVEAEHRGGQLKVDQIRALQHGLSLAPYDAQYRIAILQRFEEANRQAANALLKTLEEPPRQVVIILTAVSTDRLLPTIVSRCEVIRLRPVPAAVLIQGLSNKWQVDGDEAELLTHLSGGRPGYAFRLFQYPEEMSNRKSWLEDQLNLISSNRINRFEYVESMAKNPQSVSEILKVWLSFWRDVMLRTSNSNSPITNIDYQEKINELAQRINYEQAYRMVVKLEKVFDNLARNANPRLTLEVLMLDLPKYHPQLHTSRD